MAVVPRKRAGEVVFGGRTSSRGRNVVRWEDQSRLPTVSNLYRPTEADRQLVADWKLITHGRNDDQRPVYFVQCGGRRGPVKIGTTTSVPRRLNELRGANPNNLRVLCVVDFGGRGLESTLHSNFRNARIQREWFRFTPELSAFIRSILSVKKRSIRKPRAPW